MVAPQFLKLSVLLWKQTDQPDEGKKKKPTDNILIQSRWQGIPRSPAASGLAQDQQTNMKTVEEKGSHPPKGRPPPWVEASKNNW